MFQRILTTVLSAILISATGLVQLTNAADREAAPLIEQTRAKVQKIGVGEKARVEVKLRDKTKLKGYVSAAGEDSFTVTNAKTGVATDVAYDQVSQVKKPGGISPLTWGIIGGAAAAAVIVGVTVLHPVLCDGGAGC